MPARLILNADDFGLTPGINRAIAELHAANCLTSATLMAAGPAFADAVTIAHTHLTLGIGCHIVLTDGLPISPPKTIPTLLGADRQHLRPKLTDFLRDLLLGRVDPADIHREALAQIRHLQQQGIRVTHLDTHKHTHIFPQVIRPLLAAAREAGVPAIRNPFEPAHAPNHATLQRRLQITALNLFQPTFNRIAAITPRPDGTFGISATGDLNPQTLQELLQHLPATGTYELLCHPGYNDPDLDAVTTRLRHHRDIERQALLTEIPRILSIPNPPTLISYADLQFESTINESLISNL
jgi:predicted glycoside hydrolase/deacetylase ChbG (UPF0249 family)